MYHLQFVRIELPLKKYLKPPANSSKVGKKVKKSNILNLIYDIYEGKIQLDANDQARAEASGDVPVRQQLAEFTKYYLLQKFGLPSLRDS